MDQENVSATLTIAVPAARVFAVLADPSTHAAIDGTGWVQAAAEKAPLAEVGQIFRMDMYHSGHPDGDYRTVNKVEVLDPPRAIGWLTGQEKGDGELEFGGWLWRYDLAPLGPSETEVTLTYDWSAVPQYIRDRGIQFPPFGPEHLPNSLHHLASLVLPHRERECLEVREADVAHRPDLSGGTSRRWGCRESGAGSVPGVSAATMGRTSTEENHDG